MTTRKQARSASRAMSHAQALGMDLWMLGLESAAVIGMRSFKLAMGGDATGAETQRMVAEKITAAAELPMVMAGAGPSPEAAMKSAVRHYTKKVRANRRRLSSGKSR